MLASPVNPSPGVLKTVATIGISFVGGVAGLLQLLDWFLNPEQKKIANDWMLNAWVWLSEQSSGDFIKSMWNTKVQLALAILSTLPFWAIWFFFGLVGWHEYEHHRVSDLRQALFGFGMLAAAQTVAYSGIHRLIIRRMARVRSIGEYAWKMIAVTLLLSLCIPLTLVLKKVFPEGQHFARWVAVLLIIPLLLYLAAILEMFMLWEISLLSAVWVILAWLLSKLIKGTAAILERALSQEKNVLAALSGLCLALVAILKMFG